MNNIKYITPKLNAKQAVYGLRRPNNKCIYFNKNCHYELRAHEIEQINIILTFLYKDYLANKDNKDKIGIKMEDLSEAFAGRCKHKVSRYRVTSVTVMRLVPMFVNIRSRGKSRARLFRLNETGLQLIDLLIKDAQAGGYIKDKDNVVEDKKVATEEDYAEEDVEVEEDV